MGKWAPSIYFVLGQVGWFACVLGAAHAVPWIGVVTALVLMALHLLRVKGGAPNELKLILSVALIGAVWESMLVASGLLVYPGGMLVRGFAPTWIVALWALFAAQINTTYGWLKSRMALAVLLGAIAGPLSFRGGAALGAVRISGWRTFIVLALGWAVLLPLTIRLSRRWNGVAS